MAQKANTANIVVRGGYDSAQGSIYNIGLDVDYSCERYFSIRIGDYFDFSELNNTELRPALFHDFSFGRLSTELLFNLSTNNDIYGLALGGGVAIDTEYVWANMGYYHRTLFAGEDDTIKEPFNIYYELGIHCLASVESWDLDVIISNSRICELERHYQPTFVLSGRWWSAKRLGIGLSVEYKPGGMFHISSDFHRVVGTIGVQYKW